MGAPRPDEDGVLGSAVEVVEIEEAARLLAAGAAEVFTQHELDFARARSDPARRLAARLAAKRAALRLLGGEGLAGLDVEVQRGEYGPPSLRLSPAAARQLSELGASRALVSLTHERSHAAALVVLVDH